jgi:hypothetical protein
MKQSIEVALEVTPKRTFAVAVGWPGWTRAGRDQEAALDALLEAGPRYAAVLAAEGLVFVPPASRAAVVVVDRRPGNAGTEFGAPSVPLPGDEAPVDEAELERLVVILRSAWAAFDAAAAQHAGQPLRTGPRGGGRDLARIAEHVAEADEAYLVKLGTRPPKRTGADRAAMAALLETALATLRARVLGLPVEHPSRATTQWAPRWYVRRAAWHRLDHAWEIEDRATIPHG